MMKKKAQLERGACSLGVHARANDGLESGVAEMATKGSKGENAVATPMAITWK